MTTIRTLTPRDLDARLEALAALLKDAVDGGASVGFLPPLEPEGARAYWREVVAAVASGSRTVLVAESAGEIAGAVQLDLCTRANGRHRAEVVKLFVHRKARRQGLGRALMTALEEHAHTAGVTLLLLDTRQGDDAERLYERLGFVRAGLIPGYARSADGSLHTTVFMYKQLATR